MRQRIFLSIAIVLFYQPSALISKQHDSKLLIGKETPMKIVFSNCSDLSYEMTDSKSLDNMGPSKTKPGHDALPQNASSCLETAYLMITKTSTVKMLYYFKCPYAKYKLQLILKDVYGGFTSKTLHPKKLNQWNALTVELSGNGEKYSLYKVLLKSSRKDCKVLIKNASIWSNTLPEDAMTNIKPKQRKREIDSKDEKSSSTSWTRYRGTPWTNHNTQTTELITTISSTFKFATGTPNIDSPSDEKNLESITSSTEIYLNNSNPTIDSMQALTTDLNSAARLRLILSNILRLTINKPIQKLIATMSPISEPTTESSNTHSSVGQSSKLPTTDGNQTTKAKMIFKNTLRPTRELPRQELASNLQLFSELPSSTDTVSEHSHSSMKSPQTLTTDFKATTRTRKVLKNKAEPRTERITTIASTPEPITEMPTIKSSSDEYNTTSTIIESMVSSTATITDFITSTTDAVSTPATETPNKNVSLHGRNPESPTTESMLANNANSTAGRKAIESISEYTTETLNTKSSSDETIPELTETDFNLTTRTGKVAKNTVNVTRDKPRTLSDYVINQTISILRKHLPKFVHTKPSSILKSITFALIISAVTVLVIILFVYIAYLACRKSRKGKKCNYRCNMCTKCGITRK